MLDSCRAPSAPQPFSLAAVPPNHKATLCQKRWKDLENSSVSRLTGSVTSWKSPLPFFLSASSSCAPWANLLLALCAIFWQVSLLATFSRGKNSAALLVTPTYNAPGDKWLLLCLCCELHEKCALADGRCDIKIPPRSPLPASQSEREGARKVGWQAIIRQSSGNKTSRASLSLEAGACLMRTGEEVTSVSNTLANFRARALFLERERTVHSSGSGSASCVGNIETDAPQLRTDTLCLIILEVK